jgi:hypothetical protein
MHASPAPQSTASPPSWRGAAPRAYEPRSAEGAVLHRVLSRHLGRFLDTARTAAGKGVPRFVAKELRRFLACGDHAVPIDQLDAFLDALCESL